MLWCSSKYKVGLNLSWFSEAFENQIKIMDLPPRKITYMHIHKFDIKLQSVLNHSGPSGEQIAGEKFPQTPEKRDG